MKSLKSGWLAVNLLDVAKNYPEYLERIKSVIDTMDSLGVLVDREVKVELWSGGGGGAHGSYDPGGRVIRLFEDNSNFLEMSLVHEYGHHTSLGGGETEYEFMDRIWKRPEWRAWWDCIRENGTYRMMRNISRDVEEPWSVREYVDYLLDCREVFARCFSQWVGERSGSSVIIAQHRAANRETKGLFTWGSSEFIEIGVTMDKLMEVWDG